MSNVWFTSDTHYNHANIIKYSNRPFSTVEEMNEELITRHNSLVKHNDNVFHLGDFYFGKASSASKILSRLNGKQHLIAGNHDEKIRLSEEFSKHFEWIKDYFELRVFDKESNSRQLIIMCHYSFRVWNRSHHGSWSLYGHSHGNLYDDPHSLSMDVGVDVNNYFPVSYDQVKERMKEKVFKPVDHHKEGVR